MWIETASGIAPLECFLGFWGGSALRLGTTLSILFGFYYYHMDTSGIKMFCFHGLLSFLPRVMWNMRRVLSFDRKIDNAVGVSWC